MINDLLCRPNLLLANFLLYIAYCYHSISYKQKTVTNKRLKPSTLLQLQHLAVTYYVTTIFKHFIILNDLILHKIMFHQVAKPSLKERNSVIALETAAKYYLKVSFPVEMSLRRAARWLFFFSICACCWLPVLDWSIGRARCENEFPIRTLLLLLSALSLRPFSLGSI